jgi:hypothetical protein
MLKLARIKQKFMEQGLDRPGSYFRSLLEGDRFNNAILGREKIVIAIGSRGISNLPIFVKELVGYLKQSGKTVFVVPAMGSHGSASAEGQKKVLESLGIDEKTVAASIVSSMEVVSIGEVKLEQRRYPVCVDKVAWENSDAVLLINRIKPHTDFTGRYESGLVKMATVGLGNHKGAKQVHSLGAFGLEELMPKLAEVVFEAEKLIGGFGIVEDAYHNTAEVRWLDSSEILAEEPALLERAKSLMPKLPIEDIDLLIIRQMGKEISGVGIDTKIVGRMMIPNRPEPKSPRIELIGICDITDASYGNALGVGLADFITKRLFERIDFEALKENVLTSTFYRRGMIPLVLDDEREIVSVALEYLSRRGRAGPKVVIIRDTLNLYDMYVSQAVLEELKGRGDIEIACEPKQIRFDDENRIVAEFAD